METRKANIGARFAAFATVGAIVLSGCASTSGSIRNGSAKLVPQSVAKPPRYEAEDSIFAAVEIEGERHNVSVFASSCRAGAGEIFVADDLSSINVVRNGTRNQDELFRQICDAARVKVGKP